MSARPRPVTAESYEPKHQSTPVRTEAYTPESSGDETRSLISVLDHDSINSLLESEVEEKKTLKCPDNNVDKLSKYVDQKEWKDKKDIENKDYGKKNCLVSASCQENLERDGDEGNEQNLENSCKMESFELPHVMSPWEKWLIQKAKEDRRRQRERQANLRKKKEIEDEVKRVDKEKIQKAEVLRKEWEDKKNMEERIKMKLEQQKGKTEKELKNEEKRHVEEKAKQKYEEWMQEKKKRYRELKKKEVEKKKREEEEKQKKREENDRVFEEWRKKAKEPPKSVLKSFGYTSGKPAGFYDTRAVPVSDFYNPIPWQHPSCPREKLEKKKTVRPNNKRWDPSKYF